MQMVNDKFSTPEDKFLYEFVLLYTFIVLKYYPGNPRLDLTVKLIVQYCKFE